MRPFGYLVPPDPAAAIAAVTGRPGATFLAGGTNLVDLMKLGVATPDLLVDVTGLLPHRIEPVPGGGLRIGAGVRNSDLAADQRVPGSGCPARAGDHRNLAILGGSPHCVATHPSDMAVALAALDAVVHVEGPAGSRALPLGELYRLPGDRPDRETTLERGDLITAVELPAPGFAARSAYRKVRDRASYAFGVALVAAALDVDSGVVRDARIALGAVAPRPWRARTAERMLAGRPATAEWFGRAADAELADAAPLPDNAFKITLVRNIVVRMLCELARGELAGAAS